MRTKEQWELCPCMVIHAYLRGQYLPSDLPSLSPSPEGLCLVYFLGTHRRGQLALPMLSVAKCCVTALARYQATHLAE